jgi:hypothetical protein
MEPGRRLDFGWAKTSSGCQDLSRSANPEILGLTEFAFDLMADTKRNTGCRPMNSEKWEARSAAPTHSPPYRTTICHYCSVAVLMLGLITGLDFIASADGLNGFPQNDIIRFDPPTNATGGYPFEIRVPPFREELTPLGWVLSFPGHPISEIPGHPQLGGLAFLLPGQTGYVSRVEWVHSEFEDRTNFPVAPVSAMKRIHLDDTRYRDEYVRVTNAAVYGCDHFIPDAGFTVNEGQMATQRWIRLICHPNQYYPTCQILRCHRRIEGLLFFDPVPESITRKDDDRR